jgi:hypothetical protein
MGLAQSPSGFEQEAGVWDAATEAFFRRPKEALQRVVLSPDGSRCAVAVSRRTGQTEVRVRTVADGRNSLPSPASRGRS